MAITCKEITNLLGASFNPLLKPHGFLKTRLTWLREIDQITQVVNVQKSAWDHDPKHCSYYINLRIQLRAATMPAGSGEISARLASIVPGYDDSLLQFENCEMSECVGRIGQASAALSERGLPWLLALSSFNEIRAAYEAGSFESIFAGVGMLRAVGVTRVTERTGKTHEI